MPVMEAVRRWWQWRKRPERKLTLHERWALDEESGWPSSIERAEAALVVTDEDLGLLVGDAAMGGDDE